MKRFLLLSLLTLSVLIGRSQTPIDFSKSAALQLVFDNKEAIGLSDKELSDYTVSSSYGVASTGMTMVYLQQTYKGVPVLNQMKVLAFKNGKIVSNAGKVLEGMDNASAGYSPAPVLTAEQAVRLAFIEEKLPVPAIAAQNSTDNGRVIHFGKPTGVSEEVVANLFWLPIEKDNQVIVKLVWEVQIAPRGSDAIWHSRFDAVTGNLVDKIDIVLYEDFSGAEKRQAGKVINGRLNNFKPEFGTVVNSGQQRPESPNVVFSANYRVIPWPVEAPSFGAAAIRSNPWTAAVGNASTLGWHSDGTTDYLISRGNNVYATEDTIGADANTGLPATSSTNTSPLNFTFTPNFAVEPSMDATMQQFCITNLFYWNNIVHDITYQYGFDEVSGNFQANNQGRGGNGNDFVKAFAQSGRQTDGSHVHIGNNANFATGADGGLARMRMYLFSSVTLVHVNTPGSIAGDYQAAESGFSLSNKLAATGPKTGPVAYYADNGGTTHEACTAAGNSLAGKIAMIDRGNCSFVEKVLVAQNEGAIAVIMVNNVPNQLVTMAGDDNSITIPAVFITQENGAILKAQLANNLNVTLSGTAVFDGDLDAGIMVHEYSHGISNRLTGGPATASCLNNAEEGGEGWSDYFGLMLTTDWSTATMSGGTIARGIGTYVINEPTTGEGIRNYPYTTNIAVNPLTYAHMGITGAPWVFSNGSEVHNIGEIWCIALWEMTWGIIQQENSINTNLYNFSLSTTGGNSIALKLVTEGLRLQPCSPGFIDARNAILTADINLYGGKHQCAIWTAFAKRGMGYSALQGTSTSTTNQTAAFDLPPAPTITTQPASVSVNPGDNVNFTVAATPPINGAYILYNWQVSTDGGTNWNNVSPVNTTTQLSLTGVTAGMNGFKYRCVVTQGCATTNSAVATLTVAVPAGFTFSTPAPTTLACPATNTMDVVLGTSAFGGFSNTITVSTATVPPGGTSISFVPSTAVTPGNSVTVRLTGTASLVPGTYTFTITGTATGATTQTRDISYVITAGSPPAITAHPENVTLCAVANTSFSISSAAATSFKWQLSIDGGANWTDISNGGVYSTATTATLNITGATAALNGNRYRSIATTVCGSSTSNAGILTVNTAPAITSSPASASVCAGSNKTFSVTATGSSLTYQWYLSIDNGANFNILPNGGVYSGATSANLVITGVTAGLNNNQYRVVVTGVCPVSPLTSAAATLTVTGSLSITNNPADQTVCAGTNTSFTVVATGASTYQWQLSIDGGANWNDIANGGVYSNATTATLNITGATASLNGNRYRCVVTSGCGTLNSTAAILTVNTAPAITNSPASASVCTGTNKTFTVTATGSSLTYQWYLSIDNGANFNILPNGGVYSGTTSANLVITGVTAGLNNNQYRVVVTGVCPVSPLTSAAATLTVTTSLSITNNPADLTVCAGANPSFTVAATGAGTYQWQLSIDGGANWNDIANGGVYSNATTATLNITGATVSLNGNRYRCNLTSACGNATSTGAILTVNALPAITGQPASATLCVGANNTFSVTATGAGITYQWEISANGCAGPWVPIPLATSSSYTLTGITAGQNNTGYRCVVTGTCAPAATSNCALLTVVTAVNVTTQPVSSEICENANTSFTVAGSGTGIIYQWQVSIDGGANWTNVTNGGVYSGATTATLNITGATFAMNGYRYRAQLTNASCTTPGVSNGAATLTVDKLPVISTQPANASICVGANNTFTATAAGTGISYQWQVSTTGCAGAFANVVNGGVYSGALTPSLTITAAPVTMNGYAYKLVVTGTCAPTAVTNCVVLTVGSTVTITTQPADQTICSGSNATFTVVGNGTGILYQWQLSTNGGANWSDIGGATTASYTVTGATTALNGNRYRVNLSNAACTTPATSVGAILTVRQLPTVGLTASPLTALLPGQVTTLTATPSSSSGGVLTYSWFKDAAALANSGTTYVVDITKVGSYQVRIQETFTSPALTCTNQSAIVDITATVSNHLFIFPSPNDGTFTISYYNNGGAATTRRVTIYDSKGAAVYVAKFAVSGAYTLLPIDIRPAQRGIYYVVVGDANGKKLADGKVMVNW